MPGAPSSVCVRVTRACNARCRFCLAPPTGDAVAYGDLVRGFEWLAGLGVAKVHLCGGEPTIRRDLPEIIDAVDRLGFRCALTTNGILLRAALLKRLKSAGVTVKVSVHGPAPIHDSMLGVECYDKVTGNIRMLRSAGVSVALQTVVTRRWPDAYRHSIAFCLEVGIGKLALMPFVPRGRGVGTAGEYQLSPAQRAEFLGGIADARHRLAGRLDVRLVDLWTRDYYVVETDGQLSIQRETDAADTTVTSVW
jgi:MoaA/NifB/PqqE/SkfB family radical SAM enzyme